MINIIWINVIDICMLLLILFLSFGRLQDSRMFLQTQRFWHWWLDVCAMTWIIVAPTMPFKPSEPKTQSMFCKLYFYIAGIMLKKAAMFCCFVAICSYLSVICIASAGQDQHWHCCMEHQLLLNITTSTMLLWSCRVRWLFSLHCF